MTDDDESVGYGKPPKHSRFQKGQSGNPFGRRGQKPKPETQSEVVRRVRDEKVTIKLNGKEVEVTAFEAVVRAVFNKTMQRGSPREMKLLFDLLEQHGEMSVIDEGLRAREGADAVIDKIVTTYCRTKGLDEKEMAAVRERHAKEIEILFCFPQVVATLRKFWKAEDEKAHPDSARASSLRASVESHWNSM